MNNPLVEKADQLAHSVYCLTKNFPKEELYGIVSQLRRAALSVPLKYNRGFCPKGEQRLPSISPYCLWFSKGNEISSLFFFWRENFKQRGLFEDLSRL